MITVKIKIWKFKELLHEGNYQFNTMQEASDYQLGLFNGMNLMGAGATGTQLEGVSIIDAIIQRKESGIDCTEEESAEIKLFLKNHLEFVEHYGIDHAGKNVVELADKINELFPIEMSEVLEEI
jgi:hypothetical protein